MLRLAAVGRTDKSGLSGPLLATIWHSYPSWSNSLGFSLVKLSFALVNQAGQYSVFTRSVSGPGVNLNLSHDPRFLRRRKSPHAAFLGWSFVGLWWS
jgi:hypothetical protein